MLETVVIYGSLAVAGSAASIVMEKMHRQDLAGTMTMVTKGGIVLGFGYELYKLSTMMVFFL